MSKLSVFFHHNSNAIHAIASIFETAFAALPIAPVNREAVTGAIEELRKIGDAVKHAAPEVAKATEVKLSKADVKAAMAPVAAEVLSELVTAAVAKAMAPHINDGK
jgi:hypothetical protein